MKFLAFVVLTIALAEAMIDRSFVQRLHHAHKLNSDSTTVGQTNSVATKMVFEPTILTNHENRHLLEAAGSTQIACDQAFLKCMPNDKCVTCFGTLQTDGVDWASVAPDTPCRDVVEFLFKQDYCTSLKNDNNAIDLFCQTFDVCVAWYEGSGSSGMSNNDDSMTDDIVMTDCDSLKECQWDGMHRGFIGDGICHENYPGCYNSAVCNYDGGDCCPDTCKDSTSYAECGHDGYACRDPKSPKCDPDLTAKCEHGESGKGNNEPDPNSVTCSSNEAKYRLIMYDSFGDGWDSTKLTLTAEGNTKPIVSTSLVDGSHGTEFICLSVNPTCYHIDVNGGVWGNEVSWEIRPLADGTKSIADGGAPMSCDFSVQGLSCLRTCTGKPNADPTDDPEYKEFKDLYNCIQNKCLIQTGTCEADPSCKPCFTQDAPEYCFANENFNAVVDCGLCQCSDKTDFCSSKRSPGTVIPSDDPDTKAKQKPCNAAETLQGSAAVLSFAKCTNFDQVAMMVTDFDENHFGALDKFEACAHSFQNDSGHGGKTAMFCMTILADAIHATPSDDPAVPSEAIATLAGLLYHNAEGFCECASDASANCPLCPSFMRFKTLLYESLDACKALDEIDCDAWSEFYPTCKSNLENQFQTIDFRSTAQCEYVKGNCGDAGPFPAFRKLDCGREISKTAWDFYNLYAKSCLQGDDGIPPTPAPRTPTEPVPTAVPNPTPDVPDVPNPTPGVPTPIPITPPPVNPPPSGGGQPTPKPYTPADGGGKSKPYIPSGGEADIPATGKSGTSKDKKTGTSHFWRNIIIMGLLGYGAYWYYKRNNDSFTFVRYRHAPQRNFGSESEVMMHGGMSLTGSSSFEPPSLPPPPSAMMQHQPPHHHMGGYP